MNNEYWNVIPSSAPQGIVSLNELKVPLNEFFVLFVPFGFQLNIA